MWRIPTATSSALAAVRRQANKAMDSTGVMARLSPVITNSFIRRIRERVSFV